MVFVRLSRFGLRKAVGSRSQHTTLHNMSLQPANYYKEQGKVGDLAGQLLTQTQRNCRPSVSPSSEGKREKAGRREATRDEARMELGARFCSLLLSLLLTGR